MSERRVGFLAKLLASAVKPNAKTEEEPVEEFGRVLATTENMLRAYEALEDSYVHKAGSGATNHIGPAIKKRDPSNPLVGMDYKTVAKQWRDVDGDPKKNLKQSVIEALADKLDQANLTEDQRKRFEDVSTNFVAKVTAPESAPEDDSDSELAMFIEGKYVGSVPVGGKVIHYGEDTPESAYQKYYISTEGEWYSVNSDGVVKLDESDISLKNAIQKAVDNGDWVEEETPQIEEPPVEEPITVWNRVHVVDDPSDISDMSEGDVAIVKHQDARQTYIFNGTDWEALVPLPKDEPVAVEESVEQEQEAVAASNADIEDADSSKEE